MPFKLSNLTSFSSNVFIKVRLPKGINSIREHIEMVDNIPLHVSLFTDCTKSAINSMLEILKEHDEIVCCFGSSHSIENIKLFSEANLA